MTHTSKTGTYEPPTYIPNSQSVPKTHPLACPSSDVLSERQFVWWDAWKMASQYAQNAVKSDKMYSFCKKSADDALKAFDEAFPP